MYFDDLVINHKRGPVVETNSYYAFGLEIPGLNAKAIGFGGNASNRIKYNGKELQSKEFTDGSGLEWEDYGARMYDAQIGRWMVIDPLSEVSRRWTPYNYAYNNPIRFIDPDGMLTYDWNKKGYVDKNGKSVSDEDAAGQLADMGENVYNANSNGGDGDGDDGNRSNPISGFIKAILTKLGNWGTNTAKTKEEAATAETTREAAKEVANDGKKLYNLERDWFGWLPGANYIFIAKDLNDGQYASAGIQTFFATLPIISRSQSILGHIFRNEVGHVTPLSKTAQEFYLKLFQNVSSNSSNAAQRLLSSDAIKNGVTAYAQTFRNGKQVWVFLRPDRTIFDAGVNLIPK